MPATLAAAVVLALGQTSPGQVRDPVAWQSALDRAGFSPGIIDGKLGPKTTVALAAFQRFSGLAATGRPDAATRKSLSIDAQPALVRYALTEADRRQVGPSPTDWNAKSKLKRLGYKSLAALVAERGHCTIALVAALNPKLHVDRLRPGDVVILPNVAGSGISPPVARITVDLDHKSIQALDAKGRVVGLFHCSIAKKREKAPRGRCRVVAIAREPEYIFDPKMWPEVKNVDRKLVIAPGPRNPVGLCWIGLSLDGYGIHGTPEPELIGKTGSHGCIRLTNWDALRLAKMVRVGTPVEFHPADKRSALRLAPSETRSAEVAASPRETQTGHQDVFGLRPVVEVSPDRHLE